MTESLRNTLQSYQTRYSSGQNSHTPWPYTTLRNDNPLHVICHKHLLLIPVQLLFHCLSCHKPHLSVSNHQITVAIFVLEHTHFWHNIHISYVHLQKIQAAKTKLQPDIQHKMVTITGLFCFEKQTYAHRSFSGSTQKQWPARPWSLSAASCWSLSRLLSLARRHNTGHWIPARESWTYTSHEKQCPEAYS